jgi:hypothetical protein
MANFLLLEFDVDLASRRMLDVGKMILNEDLGSFKY